jgi:hypothetical protein
MKTLLLLAVVTGLTGCMMPKYSRLIPENKSAHIKIFNSIYGYIEIDTRVVGDTNGPLPALPSPPPF